MSRTSSKVPETLEDYYVFEKCCGSSCDQPKRDVHLKLLGVDEFLRLYKRTVILTDAQKYCMDTVASEYKMLLIPLK